MTTDFTLRPYTDADQEPSIALWLETWKLAYPSIDFDARVDWWRKRWRDELVPNAAVIVADSSGAMAGFVTIDASGYLDQLVVAPAHQGSPLATELLDDAKRRAPGGVTLKVNADNVRAIRFYVRNGFVDVGEDFNPGSNRPVRKMAWMPGRDKPKYDGGGLSDKAALRTSALARRDALFEGQRAEASQAIAARGLPIQISANAIVSGFWPIRSEIDPRPLMKTFQARGARLALPVIGMRDAPLVFRAWTDDALLKPGPLGISQPPPEAEHLIPDIVLVPLAAFDRVGHRIGYGAGLYDRTLAALRAQKPLVAIGIAFATQEIERVPATANDAPLDFVLTENETNDFRSV